MTRPKQRRSVLSQQAPDPSFSPALPRSSAFDFGDGRQDEAANKGTSRKVSSEANAAEPRSEVEQKKRKKTRNQSHPNLFPSSP